MYPKGSDGIRPPQSGLYGLAFTLLSPIMINTRIQQKSVPIIYIDPLERSIGLIFSIIINIRYVSRCVIQIYKLNSMSTMHVISSQYSLYVYSDQTPTVNCPAERRARQMAIPASPAHHARVVMTTSSDTS